MGSERAEFGRPASPGLHYWRQEDDRPCSLDFSKNLLPGFAKGVGNVKGPHLQSSIKPIYFDCPLRT